MSTGERQEVEKILKFKKIAARWRYVILYITYKNKAKNTIYALDTQNVYSHECWSDVRQTLKLNVNVAVK